MLRHLLKLIWKRKSRNMMLSLEILLAFVVVFAISAFALRSYQLYQMPTGFSYQDLWSVALNARTEGGIEADPQIYDKLRQSLKALPEVEEVSFTSFPVYEMSNWTSEFTLREGKRKFVSNLFQMSDEFPAVAHMTLAEGRWFSRADDGAAEQPVVINRRLAQKLSGGKPVLGQVFSEDEDKPKKALKQYKVVGIVEEFRSQGEFMSPTNFMLVRHQISAEGGSLDAIQLKVRPGTPRTFEAALNRQLKLVRNDWSYTISPTVDMRTTMLKALTIPLTVLAVIAAFLLVMVAFGLFGVLWQNTTQRIPEIGLRRAIGADSGHIYSQIIVEQMLLSSGAIFIALLLLVQLPLTGVLGDSLNWAVFLMATALSASVIYLLSLLCSLYPGWRAARLSPTQALHYE